VFFLVDDGSRKAFGKEMGFRAQFESCARAVFDAPVISIVIQGGPGTLKTALEATKAGTPLVVIDGSGQAADVLAYAWNFRHSSHSRHSSYSVAGLEAAIAAAFPDPKHDRTALLKEALETIRIRSRVSLIGRVLPFCLLVLKYVI
jgi:hypothetical protein